MKTCCALVYSPILTKPKLSAVKQFAEQLALRYYMHLNGKKELASFYLKSKTVKENQGTI